MVIGAQVGVVRGRFYMGIMAWSHCAARTKLLGAWKTYIIRCDKVWGMRHLCNNVAHVAPAGLRILQGPCLARAWCWITEAWCGTSTGAWSGRGQVFG